MVLEVRQHQGWMQWDNHPSGSAGDAVPAEPKAVGCPLGCQGTLLSIRAFAYFPKPAYKAISVNFNQLLNIKCFRKMKKQNGLIMFYFPES